MKKYNLSKIMKRAWELVKQAGLTISEGLKKAWKEAKEVKMEIKDLIKKYKLVLASDGIHLIAWEIEMAKTDGMLDSIKSNKDEILSILKAEKEEKEKAAKERKEKINAIEGLNEIREAIEQQEAWQRKFNSNMSNEYESFKVSSRPENKISELKEKYPRAAAYLKAESLFLSENSDISIIGKNALEKIINGENFVSVMEEAEAKRKAAMESFLNRHIWD